MATTKKSTSSKSKTTRSRAKKASASEEAYQSFKLAKPQNSFFSFCVTRQTLYWLIIALIILILGMWLIHVQIDAYKIYDEIEKAAYTSL